MKSGLAVLFLVLSAMAANAQESRPAEERRPVELQQTQVVKDYAPNPNEVRHSLFNQSRPPCTDNCANVYRDTRRLTFWFLPRPRALVEAIFPH
jgi:hypothetical protein